MADLTEKSQADAAKEENRKKVIKIVVIIAVALLAFWLAKKYIF